MTSRRTPPVEIGLSPRGRRRGDQIASVRPSPATPDAAPMTSAPTPDADAAFTLSDGSQIHLPAEVHPCAFGSRPHERPVLAEMVRLRLAGLGYHRIAAALNDRGLPTREGRRWHHVTVRHTLRRIDTRLCPPRTEAPNVPQPTAAIHRRDLDRQRKRRAALRSEEAAA